MEEQRDIQRQHRQGQSKYTYFLIALSVSSIAFSIQKTINEPLILRQIPLGLAVLSWAFSIYSGLTFLQKGLDILYTNNAYFEALKGNLAETKGNPAMNTIAANELMKILKDKIKCGSKYYIWQFRSFLTGIVLFIVWHLFEMASRTIW